MLSIGCGGAYSQSLVTNGTFDTDLTSWVASGSPAPTWSMIDANALGSGSARLVNAEAAAGARVYPLTQCFLLAPSALGYLLDASAFVPATQGSGRLVVSYGYFDTPDCIAGSASSAGGFFVGVPGVWDHGNIKLPGFTGTVHLGILLGIEKDAAGGQFIGNFDAVKVRSERVFGNGFD